MAGLLSLVGWTTVGLGGHRPQTLVVTAVLAALLLLVHGAGLLLERMPARSPVGWLLPFLGLAAASAAWVSPVPWEGWMDWFRWVCLILPLWVVNSGLGRGRPRAFLFGGLILLALGSVAVAGYQGFRQPDWRMLGEPAAPQFLGRPPGFFRNPNNAASFLLLVFLPAAVLAVRRRASAVERIGWGWVALVLGWGLFLTLSRGAWVALGVTLVLAPLAWGRAPWFRRAGLALLALALAAGAMTAVAWLAPSAASRLQLLRDQGGELTRPILWRAAAAIFREQPLLGAGAGAFNAAFEAHRPEGFADDPRWVHNDWLNTLADQGVLGTLLLVAGGYLCLRRRTEADRPPPGFPPTTGIALGLTAVAFHAWVDFPLKVPAVALTAGCLLGLALPPRPSRLERSPSVLGRWAPGALALGGAVMVALHLVPLFRAEACRGAGRAAIDRLYGVPVAAPAYRDGLDQARALLSEAVRLHPAHGAAWADLSLALSLYVPLDASRREPLVQEAWEAAVRAVALGPRLAEHRIRRGVALDLLGRWEEAGSDTAEAVRLAPTSAPAWYHHAYHLSLRPSERGLALAAAEFCLRLDPGNAGGRSLRDRLASGSGGR